jgi:hypothetical protein
MSPGKWKDQVYAAVEEASDSARRVEMASLPSAADYVGMKEWGVNKPEYSFSVGEEGRLGQRVPERYLDDRDCLKGTRLKMQCRLGCLPVMDRVGREAKPAWRKELRVCHSCGTGVVEDVTHFVYECPAYAAKRKRMMERVRKLLVSCGKHGWFASLDAKARLLVLLGQRIGAPAVENAIDRAVKQFLVKSWNIRSPLTTAINKIMGTAYGVYTAPTHVLR